ncbi:serine incorporator 1-like [Actinia tenebrosa]|uniref:Serine incorporator 1-like n=1 Tax=Actinia tenebrosa TaxID=6105 RepID=A0A6P8IHZ3_ACTTE|nr:serine incorporator 1-like [Actinia tenebrosa]
MDFQLCSVYTSVAKPAAGKVIYLGFLFIGTLLSLLAFFPGVRSFFVRHSQFCDRNLNFEKCDVLVGHVLLYRVYIGMIIFFFLISVINCQMSIFSSSASVIENGLWFLKWNLFCFFVLISLLIPEGRICHTLMHIGWIAAIIVIFMELILLIDFAKYLNSYWIEKIETSLNSKLWHFLLILITSLLYTLFIAFTIYFYVIYSTTKGCHSHSVFIAVIVFLCLGASLLSFHPKVREAGLLQAGMVATYTMYLTWSALSHSSDKKCNPTYLTSNWNDTKDDYLFSLKPIMIIDITILFGILFYGIYRVKNLNEFLNNLHLINCCSQSDEDDTDEPIESNEQAILSSSYLSYYICILLAILYILMVVSNYYTPEGILGTNKVLLETKDGMMDVNEYTKEFSMLTAMSIKMTMSFVFVLMFMWTAVASLLSA